MITMQIVYIFIVRCHSVLHCNFARSLRYIPDDPNDFVLFPNIERFVLWIARERRFFHSFIRFKLLFNIIIESIKLTSIVFEQRRFFRSGQMWYVCVCVCVSIWICFIARMKCYFCFNKCLYYEFHKIND